MLRKCRPSRHVTFATCATCATFDIAATCATFDIIPTIVDRLLELGAPKVELDFRSRFALGAGRERDGVVVVVVALIVHEAGEREEVVVPEHNTFLVGAKVGASLCGGLLGG